MLGFSRKKGRRVKLAPYSFRASRRAVPEDTPGWAEPAAPGRPARARACRPQPPPDRRPPPLPLQPLSATGLPAAARPRPTKGPRPVRLAARPYTLRGARTRRDGGHDAPCATEALLAAARVLLPPRRPYACAPRAAGVPAGSISLLLTRRAPRLDPFGCFAEDDDAEEGGGAGRCGSGSHCGGIETLAPLGSQLIPPTRRRNASPKRFSSTRCRNLFFAADMTGSERASRRTGMDAAAAAAASALEVLPGAAVGVPGMGGGVAVRHAAADRGPARRAHEAPGPRGVDPAPVEQRLPPHGARAQDGSVGVWKWRRQSPGPTRSARPQDTARLRNSEDWSMKFECEIQQMKRDCGGTCGWLHRSQFLRLGLVE